VATEHVRLLKVIEKGDPEAITRAVAQHVHGALVPPGQAGLAAE
jgi:DNA-binding FadR family transcriptional regulator